jgi:hypothetical protein
VRVANCECCELDQSVTEMAPQYAVLTTHDAADGVLCSGSGRSVPSGSVRDLILDAAVDG